MAELLAFESHTKARAVRLGAWLLLMATALLAAVLTLYWAPSALGWLVAISVLVAALGVGDRLARNEGGVAVLTYHSVSDAPGWLPWAKNISVAPETFEQHMKVLRRMGCTILSTSELVALRQARAPLPTRPVAIHLDDGYLDNWVAAVPILKRYNAPATLFVSLDFIASGSERRPTLQDVEAGAAGKADLQWEGYLNAEEIGAIDAEPLLSIESHGKDHGRVVTGPAVVDVLTADNWRRHAWVQWAAMAGDKSDWFRHTQPPAVPLGSPVHVSGGALAARQWLGAAYESEDAYKLRVGASLRTAREGLSRILGREATLLCWPENQVSAVARRIASQVGFIATTGGCGENRAHEDPTVISRVHVLDRAIGFRWPWMERLYLRATVRLYQGVYYWYLLLFPIYRLRRLVLPLTLRFECRG